MKKLIIALLFSLTAHASNFIPVSSVLNNTQAGYSLLADCKKASAPDEVCANVEDQPISTYEVYNYQADDETKPIYSKSNIVPCTDEADCKIKLISFECIAPSFQVMNLELLELYCASLTGYQQKTLKSIRQSSALLIAYLAQKALKDAEELQEQKLQEKIKLIDAGKRVVALLNLRNEPKNLTGEQIGQMVTTFASIKGLLETGSLKTAKYLISQVVADGVIVTDGDKTALIAELNKWIVE
jgi:hypothetical protein